MFVCFFLSFFSCLVFFSTAFRIHILQLRVRVQSNVSKSIMLSARIILPYSDGFARKYQGMYFFVRKELFHNWTLNYKWSFILYRSTANYLTTTLIVWNANITFYLFLCDKSNLLTGNFNGRSFLIVSLLMFLLIFNNFAGRGGTLIATVCCCGWREMKAIACNSWYPRLVKGMHLQCNKKLFVVKLWSVLFLLPICTDIRKIMTRCREIS